MQAISVKLLHFKYNICKTDYRIVTFVCLLSPLVSSECPHSNSARGSGGLDGFECWTTNISHHQPTVKLPPSPLCTLIISPAQTRNKVSNNPATETFGSPCGATSTTVTNLKSSPNGPEQVPGAVSLNWELTFASSRLTVLQRFDGLLQETAVPLPLDSPVFSPFLSTVLWCVGIVGSFCTVGLFCTLLNTEEGRESWQQRRPVCCCTWTTRPEEDAVQEWYWQQVCGDQRVQSWYIVFRSIADYYIFWHFLRCLYM